MSVLYSKLRSEIKTGDLIAYDTEEIDSFFGSVLYFYQKILKARYTHVGVAVRLNNRVFLLEATPPQVRLVPLPMCGDFYLIKTDLEADENKMLSVLVSYLGRSYSLLDLLKAKLKITNNPSDLYCSELAQEFYNMFGYLPNRRAGETPDTIVDAVVKRSGNQPIKVIIDKGNLP